MAKIIEDVIAIKLSKLAKDSEQEVAGIAGSEILETLEQVVQELVGDSVIVEVVRS